MELRGLQAIADGTVSLAELEKKDPVLGDDLKSFVDTINQCCRDAYKRFSTCLDDVLTLPSKASATAKEAVIQKLRGASDSKWFHDVAHICDQLAAVTTTYDAGITKQMERQSPGDQKMSLMYLMMALHQGEGSLKDDIRHVVDLLKVDLSNSRIADAKQRALAIKDEIDRTLERIHVVAVQITGSATDGAHETLTKDQIAKVALRRPERVLLFNMAMVAVLLILGATVLQYVTVFEFPILTAFVLTAVVIVNAFYLRSIDKLRDEPFMELMKLALLNFFAPFARRTSHQPTTHD